MIFLRVLALSLAVVSARAGGIVAAVEDDCALYLTGPGRTSAYDYSLNLLKGNFGYEGQHHCITFEAVNQAYLEARNRILVSQPKGDWKAEDYASVGELILDISINLARRYALTYEEIEKGLPLIDTSKTLIREVCPPIFSHVECRAGKYRRLDGLCNNLEHPTWGATMAPFQRLIGPLFSDGINAPRISHSGHDLPLSRVVSRTMHPDEGFHDHAGTVMVIAWGQFMDHDYTLTGTPLDPINRNDPEECCKRPPHLKHPYCNEIRVPDDDYFYRLFGVKCIDFVRGFPSPRPGCRLGSRNPFNTLTGVIDGNTVYGVTDKFARKLRTGFGGLLRMNPVFKEYGLRDLLPLKLDIPDEGCTRPNKNMYCFEAGEIRVNEQLVLTVMHTLMAREHNRVAEGLAAVNPHWDDETLFQEARRINIAEIQHITYNEFLPILLGKDVMEKFGLVLEKEGYWDGYDPNVNPDVLDSFAAAAYRFGHSLLPTAVERWSKAHKFIASKRLSDLIRRPYDLYRAGVLDEYVMGLMNQVAQAMDDSITQEVTNHLFKKVGARFGMDLVSFNMQRGREFGLPGYMEFRKFCGLPGAETFQDLFGSMPNETVRKYESIFEHPVDVDLWSGGVSERALPGSMLGPTFACVIATQFSYSRRGDRFWFELPNQPSSFTPEQLNEIRKARLARVICDNTDIIDTVQLYPMVLPDHELNPRVPCRSGIIPSMDFSKWAEPAPFHTGASKDFITVAIVKSNETIAANDNNLTDSVNSINASTPSPQLATSVEPTIRKNQSLDLTGGKCEHNCTSSHTEPIAHNKTLENKDSITKHDAPVKTSGHFKNRLRRKRSIHKRSKRAARQPIVDYETIHVANNLQTQNIPAKLEVSNLANFNIETLHDNKYSAITTTPTYRETNSENEESTTNDNSEENSRSQIKNQSKQNSGSSENSESESKEKEYSNEPTSRERDSSNSQENPIHQKQGKEYAASDEKQNDSREIQSSENTDTPKNYDIGRDDSTQEKDKEDYLSQRKTFLNSDQHSPEQSDESSTKKLEPLQSSAENDGNTKRQNKYQEPLLKFKNDTSAEQEFREVDLDEFSYEKINFDKKGKEVPVNDAYKNNESTEEKSFLTKIQSNDQFDEEVEPNKNSSLENSDEIVNEEKPIKFNDDKIKPVVELHSVESNESDEENVDDKQLNDKIVAEPKNSNVKQQFERIPLNYDHDSVITTTPKNEKQETNNKSPQEVDPGQNIRFDEHLNTKFSDLTIKLPEIKLPDDILSYAYKPPSSYKKTSNQRKPKFYHYENEQSEEVTNPDDNKQRLRDKEPSNQPKPKFYHYEDEQSEEVGNQNEDKQRLRDEESTSQPKPKFYHYEDEQSGEVGNHDEEKQKLRDKEDHDDDDDDVDDDTPVPYQGYGNARYQQEESKKTKPKESEEDEEEDLYEKFVRERFGKKGTFEKRSENLHNSIYNIPENTELFQNLQNVVQRTAKLQMEAQKSNDPNGGYMWTLEYGKKLVK